MVVVSVSVIWLIKERASILILRRTLVTVSVRYLRVCRRCYWRPVSVFAGWATSLGLSNAGSTLWVGAFSTMVSTSCDL